MPTIDGRSVSIREYYLHYQPHIDSHISKYVYSLEIKLDESNKQNEKLKNELEELKRQIKSDIFKKIEKDMEPLKEDLKTKNTQINELLKENKRLKDELGIISNEKEILDKIIKKDSKNSSKPSSTDSIYKAVNSRTKSNNKKGGQIGHRTNVKTLFTYPNETITHKKEICNCGGYINYSNEMTSIQEVSYRLEKHIKQHNYFQGVCSSCGMKHTNDAKKHYKINPIIFDKSIETLIVYLSVFDNIPVNKVSKTIKELLGITVSESQVLNIVKKYGYKIQKEREITKNILSDSKILYVDETPIKYNDHLLWITSLSNSKDNVMFLNDEKGSKTSKELDYILSSFKGTLIHDHFKRYYSFDMCSHAECNAHALRYLRFGYEIEKSNECGALIELLLNAHRNRHTINYDYVKSEYLKLIDKALLESPNTKYKPTYINLLKRMKEYVEEHLLFLRDPNVPFTNNEAERTFRHFKTKQKVSGRFYNRDVIKAQIDIKAYINSNDNIWIETLNNL